MNPNYLNLYIVEDDDALRRSLVSLLTAHLDDLAVRAFSSGEAFLENADLYAGGVVVMDFRMEPGMSGLETFKRLQERNSRLVVVFLSGHGTIPDAVRAMEDGAVSWLPKPCPDAELVQVVKRAKERSWQIASRWKERQMALQKWETLSAREKQIAFPVSNGRSSKETVKDFKPVDIDRRTVDGHRARMFGKLELHSGAELQAFLRDHALVEEARTAFSKRDKGP
jgi:FixJ family two-component response regulator